LHELKDVIIRDSDKQFRLRINGFLRSIGVSQIIGTEEYLEIEFIGGHSITVFYANELGSLPKAVESQLLLEMQLSIKNIYNIKYYIKDYIDEIKEAVKEQVFKSYE
jgi:hypothetical protein